MPETLCFKLVTVEEIHKLLEGVRYAIGVVGVADSFLLPASEHFILVAKVAPFQ